MNLHSIPKPSTLPSAPLASGSSHPPFEKPAAIANSYAEEVSKSKSTPWYRTTKGLVIIIVAASVVVGIAVGVAVGVTQSNKNKSQSGEALKSGEEDQLPTSAATNVGGTGVSTGGGGTGVATNTGVVTNSNGFTGIRPIQTP